MGQSAGVTLCPALGEHKVLHRNSNICKIDFMQSFQSKAHIGQRCQNSSSLFRYLRPLKSRWFPRFCFTSHLPDAYVSFHRRSNFHEMAPRFIQRNRILPRVKPERLSGKAEHRRSARPPCEGAGRQDGLGMGFSSCSEYASIIYKFNNQHIPLHLASVPAAAERNPRRNPAAPAARPSRWPSSPTRLRQQRDSGHTGRSEIPTPATTVRGQNGATADFCKKNSAGKKSI